MIDQDEIRKDVALKNNVWLGENDPILQSVTIFEKALEQSVDELNAQQEANVKALINAIQQGHVEAKKTASKIINEASGYVSDQANNAISAAMSEGREEFKKLLSNYLQAMDEMKYEATTAKNMSYIAMAVSVAAALGSLWLTVT